MYNITRADAAEKLGVSTRSVDRYVKSGKLRSKKEGKIIYIHS
jgi:predicted site-specific integrase-resolvase